jgi:hypothetical protein
MAGLAQHLGRSTNLPLRARIQSGRAHADQMACLRLDGGNRPIFWVRLVSGPFPTRVKLDGEAQLGQIYACDFTNTGIFVDGECAEFLKGRQQA